MKNICINIAILLSFISLQNVISSSVRGEVREIARVSVSIREQFPNYGVVIWVVSGAEGQPYSLGFTPEQGFVHLRNLISSQLGELPSKIQIKAANGAVIENDASLQDYVRWCIEQNTPMIFVVCGK